MFCTTELDQFPTRKKASESVNELNSTQRIKETHRGKSIFCKAISSVPGHSTEGKTNYFLLQIVCASNAFIFIAKLKAGGGKNLFLRS